jgi:hypothetical protein
MSSRYLYVIILLLTSVLAIGQKRTENESLRPQSKQFEDAGIIDKKTFQHQIEWFGVESVQTIDERELKRLNFADAHLSGDQGMPYATHVIELGSELIRFEVALSGYEAVALTEAESRLAASFLLGPEFKITHAIKKSANKYFAAVSIIPFRKRGGKIERLVGYNLDIQKGSAASRSTRGGASWKNTSVLSAGVWHRFSTASDGIYKLDYKTLRDLQIISNDVPSNEIRLFGASAGMLPFANDQERTDDLEQIPISMEDGGDGVFGAGDYFLFYGEDQIKWRLDAQNRYVHELNAFADSSYYFLNIGTVNEPQKRIIPQNISATQSYTSSTYDHVDLIEEELVNLIGSGRTWYGESLSNLPSKDFGFNVPAIDRNTECWVRSAWAARSIGIAGTRMQMSFLNNAANVFMDVDPVADFYGALYADNGVLTMSGLPTGNEVIVKLEYQKAANPQAQAWLDFIELNARRQLNYNSGSFIVRDKLAPAGVVQFNLISSKNIRIWRVDDVKNTTEFVVSGGVVNGFRTKVNHDLGASYIVFADDDVKQPRYAGGLSNQNLHGIRDVEYVIISHPQFISSAQRLADLHQNLDGLKSVIVTPQQVYNEFSGGAQDVTAIKEFMRKLYFEADSLGTAKPRYLLLFGDASYDYKNKLTGNSNFVPTHQMLNSLSPTASIASDDYFGLLDDDEGEAPGDFIDIGVGRLPARNRTDASNMVSKIERYAERSSSFGEWRNRIAFVADDADPGDRHTFMRDFEGIGALIEARSPRFVVDKLYMDAFKQQVGSGGERYPEGAKALSDRVEDGSLMMFFIGHGGELGWAHERILEVPTINKWENLNNLPLFITATCEFARFDDPRRTSGGEYVLINPNGGGIALLTTTRAVYSSPNLTLTTAFTEEAFNRPVGDAPRLGDLMLQTKIRTLDTNSSAALNSRSFALLGDPALKLAYPALNVEVTDMPDTIKALEKVRVSGRITDAAGNTVEDFNGLVYPAVYDKESKLQTLNNDGVGPFDFVQWKNLAFKGKATVKNGQFSFEFIVPRDIDRSFDIGRINFYANTGTTDANGDYRSYVIGGLSDNPIEDSEGPQIGLFMNDNDFVFGGMTNEDPDLYAELQDEHGINMVGSGIGHDITAVLDNNTANTIILNDFYESDVDSYKSGKVRYPFNDLEEGKHNLKLKVWDVNNNPNEAYLEFIVANDEKLVLEHVLNYPNPFTTNTDFYFEHNKPGQNLSVRIEVFTVAGKLIKTLAGEYNADGYRIGPINWNGRDEYGDILARGVYMYRVSVSTPIGETVEKFERLVLLR